MIDFKELLIKEQEYTHQAAQLASSPGMMTLEKIEEFHMLTDRIVTLRRALIGHPNYHPNASYTTH